MLLSLFLTPWGLPQIYFEHVINGLRCNFVSERLQLSSPSLSTRSKLIFPQKNNSNVSSASFHYSHPRLYRECQRSRPNERGGWRLSRHVEGGSTGLEGVQKWRHVWHVWWVRVLHQLLPQQALNWEELLVFSKGLRLEGVMRRIMLSFTDGTQSTSLVYFPLFPLGSEFGVFASCTAFSPVELNDTSSIIAVRKCMEMYGSLFLAECFNCMRM